jgi:hypothetical protein
MLVMRAQELILKPKPIVKAGDWKSGQRMSKTVFPLSPTRPFQLGPKWTWRVDVLDCDGVECRLLTAFEPMKQTYIAWLSYAKGGGYTLAVRLEFHGDEPGWHCHSCCGPVSNIPVGIVKPLGTMRIPKARAFHRRTAYDMTESDALAKSFKFFRVQAEAGTMI